MTAKVFPAKAALVIANPKSKLLDQLKEVLRLKHYSLRTEEAYVQWVRRYLIFCRDNTHLIRPEATFSPSDAEKGRTPHPGPLPIRPTNAERGSNGFIRVSLAGLRLWRSSIIWLMWSMWQRPRKIKR